MENEELPFYGSDPLGDRMKEYENISRNYLPRRSYTLVRIDGKAFHTFTKKHNFDTPFDGRLMTTMDLTAKFLCKQMQNARFAYVQSDEISILMTDFEQPGTSAWFDNNIQKIASVSASMASSFFNAIITHPTWQTAYSHRWAQLSERYPPEEFGDDVLPGPHAVFDARVFSIPDPMEVENYFIWRQLDATRNSLQMLARSLYSHKELFGKTQRDMHDMIHEKGENWNNLPVRSKRGGFIDHLSGKPLTDEEQSLLTEYHRAKRAFPQLRAPDNLPSVERSKWSPIEVPVFTQDRDFLRSRIPKHPIT